MSRLILLCGDRGTGVAAHVEATALAVDDEGLSVATIDVDDCGGDAAALSAVAAVFDATLGELGAEAMPPEAWSALPGVADLGALLAIAQATADHDVVVVDAGDPRRARELVTLPSVLLRVLGQALTPRMAMWRPAGAVQQPFDVLSAARLTVLRLEGMLQRPSTTMRLIARPDTADVDRVLRAGAAIAMLGVGVDGYIVAPFPRSSDGEKARRRADRLLAGFSESAEGVLVWKSTRIARPVPKGRSAVGPLGRVHVLDEQQVTVVADDEEFTLDVPLAAPARREARIGTVDGRLVVAFDGSTRWLDLPPVLQRCTPVDAVRTSSGVRIAFRPDPAVWPSKEAS